MGQQQVQPFTASSLTKTIPQSPIMLQRASFSLRVQLNVKNGPYESGNSGTELIIHKDTRFRVTPRTGSRLMDEEGSTGRTVTWRP